MENQSKLNCKSEKFNTIVNFGLDNVYIKFIDSCRSLKIVENEYCEIHHIIPLSHGGFTTNENLIRLSYANHIEAHKLLFEVTGNKVDQYIYCMMSGQTTESRKLFKILGAYASHKKQKALKGQIFTRDFQKKMAQRSLLSEKAKKARQEVGARLGKKRQEYRIFSLSQKFVLTRKNCEIVCPINCKTGQDIGRLLSRIDPIVHGRMKKSQLRITRIIKDPTKSLYK